MVIHKKMLVTMMLNGNKVKTEGLVYYINDETLELLKSRGIDIRLLTRSLDKVDDITKGYHTQTQDIYGRLNIIPKRFGETNLAVRRATGNYSVVVNYEEHYSNEVTFHFKMIDATTVQITNGYFGKRVPLEPNDPKLRVGDMVESVEFWNHHGFIYLGSMFYRGSITTEPYDIPLELLYKTEDNVDLDNTRLEYGTIHLKHCPETGDKYITYDKRPPIGICHMVFGVMCYVNINDILNIKILLLSLERNKILSNDSKYQSPIYDTVGGLAISNNMFKFSKTVPDHKTTNKKIKENKNG